MAESVDSKDFDLVYQRTSKVLAWSGSMCFALFALLLVPVLMNAKLDPDLATASAIMLLWSGVRIPVRLPQCALYSCGWVTEQAKYELAIAATRGLAPIVSVLIIPSLAVMALGATLAELAVVLIAKRSWINHRQALKRSISHALPTCRSIFLFGLGNSFNSLATIALGYLGTFFCGTTLGPASAAQYQYNSLPGQVLQRTGGIVPHTLFPRMVSTENAHPLDSATEKWLLLTLLGFCLLAVPCALLTPDFVNWWLSPALSLDWHFSSIMAIGAVIAIAHTIATVIARARLKRSTAIAGTAILAPTTALCLIYLREIQGPLDVLSSVVIGQSTSLIGLSLILSLHFRSRRSTERHSKEPTEDNPVMVGHPE